MDLFAPINKLYGVGSSALLAEAHICVVGVGGVGSWTAEALARCGVGQITLIDGDEVCASNTNRQLHALHGNFGRAKVQVLTERMQLINPDIRAHAIAEMLTKDSMARLIRPEFDFVIDACDSLNIKVAVIAHCKRNKIKILTVGAAGGRTDPTRDDQLGSRQFWVWLEVSGAVLPTQTNHAFGHAVV